MYFSILFFKNYSSNSFNNDKDVFYRINHTAMARSFAGPYTPTESEPLNQKHQSQIVHSAKALFRCQKTTSLYHKSMCIGVVFVVNDEVVVADYSGPSLNAWNDGFKRPYSGGCLHSPNESAADDAFVNKGVAHF